ncbi:OLC1v1022518C1 [Oldenlandia corymbosa var. corymbosa]|uniref:Mitochondrial import inner membrane translocase subunit TIM50 n=1 Tax=Oldenlandia corymbosa var. corymbosa TaxID=529605 RepID=A0AAV1C0M2_OLDCO|nr:OLC1v1022518C1 [Oldenlandia corymbosa var. corymbosa]
MLPVIRSRVSSCIFRARNRRPWSSSNQPPEPLKEPTILASSTILDQTGLDQKSPAHTLPPEAVTRTPVSPPPPTPPPEAVAAQSIPPPPPPPPPPPAEGVAQKKSWRFLKAGLFAAVTGGVATAGYATYAYSSDEINEKLKFLQAYTNYTAPEDASDFDKYKGLLLSGVMTVPAKLGEIYLDLRRFAEDQIQGFSDPPSDKLLPDLAPQEAHVFTLVLDLNDTLIHTDWNRDRGWRTFKRPGVDAFLEHLAQFYEIVLYTDQMTMFIDPVVLKLDPQHCIRYKLDRVATRYKDGKHYRDLSILNRDPSRVLYVSAHALETTLQPENAVPIKEWKGEADDTELLDLIPFLEFVAKMRPPDIRTTLASYQGHDIPKEFIKRSKEHQRRSQEQRQTKRLFGR